MQFQEKNGTVQLYLNMTYLSASQRASRQTAVFLFKIVLEFLTETWMVEWTMGTIGRW